MGWVTEVIANKGKYDYDLIIVGGGSAAVSASIRANEFGLKTLIVNKGLIRDFKRSLHIHCEWR